MTPFQIILLVLLVPITIFNLLFLTSGRKKSKEGQMRYQRIMTELSYKAIDELGSSKSLEFFPFMSDSGKGCLLCFDRKKDIEALVTYDEVFKMKISDPKSCEVIKDVENGKTLKSIYCEVENPQTGESIVIPICEKPHRAKGYFGKFLQKDAEDFKCKVLGIEG